MDSVSIATGHAVDVVDIGIGSVMLGAEKEQKHVHLLPS